MDTDTPLANQESDMIDKEVIQVINEPPSDKQGDNFKIGGTETHILKSE